LIMEQIKINEETVERLKRLIIIQENQNLKTKTMSDSQMVDWIKKKIEEEVKCYLNR
jgi:predicted house-cleaning noncanonical NTP pyrophosphatase (MazG superfamily)